MSRVGKNPVVVPAGVTVDLQGQALKVKGKRGELAFVVHDDVEISREEMRAARRRLRTRSVDSRYIHKDGRFVTLSWMGKWSEPVRRHFFIGRDMTESRLAQQALHESEQLARGIMSDAEARAANVGGEVLCKVF